MTLRDLITSIVMGELIGSSASKQLLPLLQDVSPPVVTGENVTNEVLTVGQMITYINSGLTDLHTRLNLRTEEMFLDCYEHMDTYELSQPYAEYSGQRYPQQPKYIADTFDMPFQSNILEIITVSDEKGERLFTNDTNAEWSVFVRNNNVIQVPYAEEYISLSIVYRANHPKIPFSLFGSYINTIGEQIDEYFDWDTPIQLPNFAQQALNYYVAARYYSNLSSAEALAESNMYTQMYENSINNIRMANPIHGDYTENENLEATGWV